MEVVSGDGANGRPLFDPLTEFHIERAVRCVAIGITIVAENDGVPLIAAIVTGIENLATDDGNCLTAVWDLQVISGMKAPASTPGGPERAA